MEKLREMKKFRKEIGRVRVYMEVIAQMCVKAIGEQRKRESREREERKKSISKMEHQQESEMRKREKSKAEKKKG